MQEVNEGIFSKEIKMPLYISRGLAAAINDEDFVEVLENLLNGYGFIKRQFPMIKDTIPDIALQIEAIQDLPTQVKMVKVKVPNKPDKEVPDKDSLNEFKKLYNKKLKKYYDVLDTLKINNNGV